MVCINYNLVSLFKTVRPTYGDRVIYICLVLFINRTINVYITNLSASFPFAMDIIRFMSHYFSVSKTFLRSWQYLPFYMQCTV